MIIADVVDVFPDLLRNFHVDYLKAYCAPKTLIRHKFMML